MAEIIARKRKAMADIIARKKEAALSLLEMPAGLGSGYREMPQWQVAVNKARALRKLTLSIRREMGY